MPMIAAAAATAITYIGTASAAVAAGTAGVAQTLAVVAANVALSAGLSAATKALGPAGSGSSRDPLEWVADVDGAIPFPIARVAMAGKLVHASDGYGGDNRYTSLVSVYSGAGPIKGIVRFESADVVTTLDANGVASSGEHSGAMAVQFALGTQPQAALTPTPALVGSAVMPGWGSASKLNGKAHSVETLYENSKFNEFQGGEEKPLVVLDGRYGWDPRLDSTWPGGAGPCRLLVPSTWVWTDDGAIAGLNWSIGYWEGDSGGGLYGVPYACSQVGGIGASLDGIDVASFVYAANVADANGWKMAGIPDSGMDESQVLDWMLQAAGAERARDAGRISCCSYGAPQASLLTVTVRDTAGPVELALLQSRLERKNTATPYCLAPGAGWQQSPLGAAITDAAWVTEDRGAKRSTRLDLPYVSAIDQDGADQAAQIAYYNLADAREPISGVVPFKPHMRRIKKGDCFTFSAPGLHLDGVKVKCRKREFDPMTGVVRITFRQETDAKHTAALAQVGVMPSSSTGSTPPPVYVEPPTEFSAEPLGYHTTVAWRAPFSSNFDYVEIHRGATTSFGSAISRGTLASAPGSYASIDDVRPSTADFYYWLTAVDQDGNRSDPVGPILVEYGV